MVQKLDQPVKTGGTGSDDATVVVVDVGAGSERVNNSTKVWFPEPLLERPTATHDDALTHDTEFKMFALDPGFGLGTIDHVVPLHDNTNV